MATAPVLIIGAGPTGLCLALSLARRGAPLRIISDAKGPGERSRAMAVHARTLEFYSQFGFADEVIAEGLKAERVQVRDDGREVASFSLKEFGQGLSPYPFLLTYPQDDHERFLVSKLKEAGCEIQWNTKLMGFREGAEGVCATIAHDDGRIENSWAAYICGCDGAHSCVRETLGLSFAGRTYQQLFYVADVKISGGFDRQLYANLGAHALGLMFPVRSSGMQRLIGLVPSELSARSDLKFDDIRGQLEPLLKVKVVEVNWFSTYRVHHRVAERFRLGRAFLLGDAGHIHSPAGGQGMNTGIGDAINLGWKLAQVLQGRAPDSLLASYEEERIGFARALVATTDRAFTPMVAKGPWGEFTRRAAAPLLLRVATGFRFTRRMMFRMISQIHIHYRQSALSEGKAGKVRGGDRLAWMPTTPDNYAPLRSLDWQMHVYGSADEGFTQACREIGLPVHAFAWGQEATSSGFRRGAAYLVRPDGYVALATEDQSISRLTSFADRNGLRFGVLGHH